MSNLDLISHWYAYIYDCQENQTDDVALLLSVLGNKPKNVLEVCGGTFDPVTQMTNGKSRTEITLSTGEKFSFEKISRKLIPTLENVHDWLSENAFIVEQEYGSFNRDHISENTHRAIIYARKN